MQTQRNKQKIRARILKALVSPSHQASIFKLLLVVHVLCITTSQFLCELCAYLM